MLPNAFTSKINFKSQKKNTWQSVSMLHASQKNTSAFRRRAMRR